MSAKNNPSDFLKTVIGRPVVVKLNSGVDYRGAAAMPAPHPLACDRQRKRPCVRVSSLTKRWRVPAGVLACLDGYMNIAMEQTEEYVNGQLKAKYGDTCIRGNNGALVRPTNLGLVDCTGHRPLVVHGCLHGRLHGRLHGS